MNAVTKLEQAMPGSFAVEVNLDSLTFDWSFERHHLIYVTEGLLELEADDASWRLPPSRAVWMHAGSKGKATCNGKVKGISVFFANDFTVSETFHCRVFNLTALAREMIHHAPTWGPDRAPVNAKADRFYLSLADVCQDLITKPEQLSLPKSALPELQAVLDYTVKHIDTPLSFKELAEKACMSERTLARKLSNDIYMTWSQYQTRARMIHAMDLLSRGHNVSQTALAVGYQNMSAFSTAFSNTTSFSPSQFQKSLVA